MYLKFKVVGNDYLMCNYKSFSIFWKRLQLFCEQVIKRLIISRIIRGDNYHDSNTVLMIEWIVKLMQQKDVSTRQITISS